MRQQELFSLRWTDINFSESVLSVRKVVTENNIGARRLKDPKTILSRRAILLSPSAIERLKQRRERMLLEGHDSEFVFPETNGEILPKSNFVRDTWHKFRKQAGIPETVVFHDLRHTRQPATGTVNSP